MYLGINSTIWWVHSWTQFGNLTLGQAPSLSSFLGLCMRNQGLGEALRETQPGWLVTQMSPHLAVVTALGWEVCSTFTLGSYGGFQPHRSQVTSTVPSLVAFKVNHNFRGVSRMIDEPKKWKMKSQWMISWIHQAVFRIYFFNSNDFMENLSWLERIMNKLRDKFWVTHRSSFFKYGGRGDCLEDTWLMAPAGFTVIGTREWTAVAGVALDTRTQDWQHLLRKSWELCCLFC